MSEKSAHSKAPIAGLQIFPFETHSDARGSFTEIYNRQISQLLPGIDFIQDNLIKSNWGSVRGLHFQHKPFDQNKLLTVVYGEIYDVVVDLRQTSPTYLNINTLQMTEKSGAVFIPAGCAHGFQTISGISIVCYKTDKYFERNSQGGVIYSDPSLAIDWPIKEAKLSSADLLLSTLSEIDFPI